MFKPTPEDYRPIRFARLDKSERDRVFGASRITLHQEEAGEPGRHYLMVERGLDVVTIARFLLGFVPFNVNHDFKGRIVMPIMDPYGHLLTLSVRPLIDLRPKYWNESFVKGEQLYGLWLAKYGICRMGFAVVVEGQLDVCMMHAHGFDNTVGLMGGAFTPIQAQSLRRWTRQVVFLMDGDQAGKEASERAKEILDYYQFNRSDDARAFRYAIADMPAKDDISDPAKFLRRLGSLEMRKLIANPMRLAGLAIPEGMFPEERR